ncbi:hypothetical protein DUNSADRAFT_9035, partial [Dunaliella salina]
TSTPTQGISVIATSTLLHLLAGQQQASPRLWRHLHHLHVEAAAAAATYTSPTAEALAAASMPVFSTYSTSAVHNAMAHHTLLELAHGPACVPELLAIGRTGMLQAARVLGVALDKMLGCVHGLLHAQLLPRGWQFDTSQIWSVLRRTRVAAVKAGPESWHITHTVQRLMFEAGRQVMGLLDRDETSRDVLARVLLHSTGRELGALLKGRFDNVLQAIANEERAKSDRILDVPVVGPPKPTRSSRIPRELLGSGSGRASPTAPPARCSDAPATLALEPPAPEVRELAALWQSYADNAEGPAMTRLRVSLAGKISPTDINVLIAVARANIQHLMHTGPFTKPLPPHTPRSVSGSQTPLTQWSSPMAPGNASDSQAHAQELQEQQQQQQQQRKQSARPHSVVDQKAFFHGQAGQGQQPQGWRWLHKLPVGLAEDALLAQVAITATITAKNHASARDLARPRADAATTRECSNGLAPLRTPSSTPEWDPMHPLGAEASGESGGGDLQRTSGQSSDSSDFGSLMRGVRGESQEHFHGQPPFGPSVAGSPGVGSLLHTLGASHGHHRSMVQRSRDVFAQPEYGACLAGVAHYLAEGFYEGGNVLLSGHVTQTLTDVGVLAAAAVGASVLRLLLPSPGAMEQAMPLTQGSIASGVGASGTSATAVAAQATLSHAQPPLALRQQLLALLVQVLADDVGHGAVSGANGASAGAGAVGDTDAACASGYVENGPAFGAHAGATNDVVSQTANKTVQRQDGPEGSADGLASQVDAPILTGAAASKEGVEPVGGAVRCGSAGGQVDSSRVGQGAHGDTPEDGEWSDDFEHAAIFECAAEQEWVMDTLQQAAPPVESAPHVSDLRGSNPSNSHKADPASHAGPHESKRDAQGTSQPSSSDKAGPAAHAQSHATGQGAQHTGEHVQSEQPHPLSGTRTPNHRRRLARRPVKRFVLVVEEEAAMDEGLMELLQQLVCCPWSVASLATDEYARGLARAVDREVAGMVEIGAMQSVAGLTAIPGIDMLSDSLPEPGTSMQHAGVHESLHSLMDYRYTLEMEAHHVHTAWLSQGTLATPEHLLKPHHDSALPQSTVSSSDPTPPSPSKADIGLSLTPAKEPRGQHISSAVNQQQGSPKRPLKRGGVGSRPHSSVGGGAKGRHGLAEEGVRAAQEKVDCLRNQQATLAHATAEAARRLTRRVRIILAVSPACTAVLQAKFPALCQALSLVQGPPLLYTGPSLQPSMQHMLHAHMLLQPHQPHTHPSRPPTAAVTTQSAVLKKHWATRQPAMAAAAQIEEPAAAEEPKLSSVGQRLLGNSVPHPPASRLHAAQEEASTSDTAALFAQQVLDKHAAAAALAAGHPPRTNPQTDAAQQPTQPDTAAPAAREHSHLLPYSTPVGSAPSSAGEPKAQNLGGTDTGGGGAGSNSWQGSVIGDNRRRLTAQEQLDGLEVVLAVIHAQAQELMWQ